MKSLGKSAHKMPYSIHKLVDDWSNTIVPLLVSTHFRRLKPGAGGKDAQWSLLSNGKTLNSLYILDFRFYHNRIHQTELYMNGPLSYTQDTNTILTYTITLYIYQNEMR